MAGDRSLAWTLSRAVVESMSASGVSQDDFLTGQIKLTSLPWQVPPLHVLAPLMKMPLKDYLDRPTWISVEHMTTLWTDGLMMLRNAPSKVLTETGAYRAASLAIPHIKAPERMLRLSVPEGFPHGVSDQTGAVLSLEVAHLFKDNARIKTFVYDENSYYAVMPDGTEVGIKDGYPTECAQEWDISVEGIVQEMLESGRGAVWEGCDYDIIAKTRSLLHEKRWNFHEHEGLDWALQALRVLDGRSALLRAIQSARAMIYSRNLRRTRLSEAREVAYRNTISDRARIETLRGLLVPEVLSPSQFTKRVYSYSSVVPVLLSTTSLAKVRAGIDQLLEEEEAYYAISS